MFGLAICCCTVATMIGAGYLMQRKGYKGNRAIYAISLGVSSFLVFAGAALSLTAHPAFAAAAAAPLGTAAGMGFIAASVSTGLACLGAGLAVASVGSAALGLVGEKPEMLGTTLIYLGLSEGIAIYGVIVSLLILGRI
ncbi:MAG: ATP synthase subunit C [Synergistaceae bacterium]|nr:ATP synthase subunit C [Synergistaceae bacterium]